MFYASIFGDFANSALNGIASAFAKAANLFLTVFFNAISATTSLSLSGSTFTKEFDAIFMVGLLLALGLAFIEIIAGALAKSGKRIAKVPANLVLMILGTIASVAMVSLLLAATDQLCAGLIAATGFNTSLAVFTAAIAAVLLTDPAAALIACSLLILVIGGCLISLMVRKVLLLVAVVFAPLALAGATAQATRSWVRRWIETTLALIVSKLILVILILTGLGLMEGMGSSNAASALTSLLGGIGIIALAAFSPVAAMKMVSFTGGHFAEAAAVGHGALSSATDVVGKPAKMAAAVSTGGASGAAMALGGTGLSAAAAATMDGAKTPSPPSGVDTDVTTVGATEMASAMVGSSEAARSVPSDAPSTATSETTAATVVDAPAQASQRGAPATTQASQRGAPATTQASASGSQSAPSSQGSSSSANVRSTPSTPSAASTPTATGATPLSQPSPPAAPAKSTPLTYSAPEVATTESGPSTAGPTPAPNTPEGDGWTFSASTEAKTVPPLPDLSLPATAVPSPPPAPSEGA